MRAHLESDGRPLGGVPTAARERGLAGDGDGGGVAYKDLKLLEVERVNLLTRGKESLESKN